ncbi:MAG: sigma-70 family RNA polymerase sigma factor [Ruminiclostridium sp.]|nr:sigma-70 family RNA polymerase sigma factor [Ruminiclostridium sp.]
MLSVYMAMLDEPGDKAQFEEAYNRYKGKMLSIAYKITGNYHDAEEAVSSAFFAIARNFGKLRERTPQERAAFYCVVTKNCSYDLLRKKDSRNEIPLDDDGFEVEDESTDVSDEALSDIGYSRIVDAIRSLPEQYAQVLYMRCVTGLPTKEIAEITGETDAGIRKRLERARARLREILDEQGITV